MKKSGTNTNSSVRKHIHVVQTKEFFFHEEKKLPLLIANLREDKERRSNDNEEIQN